MALLGPARSVQETLSAAIVADPLVVCDFPGCGKTFPESQRFAFSNCLVSTGDPLIAGFRCPDLHIGCSLEHALALSNACMVEHVQELHRRASEVADARRAALTPPAPVTVAEAPQQPTITIDPLTETQVQQELAEVVPQEAPPAAPSEPTAPVDVAPAPMDTPAPEAVPSEPEAMPAPEVAPAPEVPTSEPAPDTAVVADAPVDAPQPQPDTPVQEMPVVVADAPPEASEPASEAPPETPAP